MTPIDQPSHRLTLRFTDDALERAFLDDYARGARRHFRFVMWMGLVMYLLPGLADVSPGVPGGSTRLLIRYGLCAPLLVVGCCFGFAPRALFDRHFQWVTASTVGALLLSLVALYFVDAAPMELRPAVLAGLSVVTLGLHTILLLRHAWATAVGVLVTLAFVAVGIIHGVPPSSTVNLFLMTVFYLLVANGLGMFGSRALERYRRRDFLQRRAIEHEQARSERLLLNVLPEPIARRLKGDERIADRFDDITVLFADLVGFTPLAETLRPEELVSTLDELFSEFDDIAERHGLEKIKTIGDAYMVVGGLPVEREDHAEAVALMALEMRDALVRRSERGGPGLKLRIGIHTGPAVAGVIGKRKFIYDLWGDTVNLASRMESHGLEGAIQVTEATYLRLSATFELEPRGPIQVKGKGSIPTWLLQSRR